MRFTSEFLEAVQFELNEARREHPDVIPGEVLRTLVEEVAELAEVYERAGYRAPHGNYAWRRKAVRVAALAMRLWWEAK